VEQFLKLLETKNISKYFTNTKALKGVNFDLKKGEVHILLGENGAGKSTLIKILSGAYKQDEGELYIKGKLIKDNTPLKACKLGLFTIYQEFNLVPYLSVAENIFLGSLPLYRGFIDRKAMLKNAQKLLSRLDVNIDPNTTITDLGVAQKQMVEIAKALREEGGDILIFDEPTAALTGEERARLFKIIEQLKRKGVGIIYISHRLEEIKMIGDRVTILRDGEMIDTLQVNEKINEEKVIQLMTGRDFKQIFRKTKKERGKALIEIKNVRNISFTGYSGEILGIFGLMGCGNIEIARSLVGANRYEQGEINITGIVHSLPKGSTIKAIKAGINYLPPDRKDEGLVEEMSVGSNITLSSLDLFKRLFFIDQKKERNHCQKMINQLNIKTPEIDTGVSSLSGGNQQKVIVARVLSRNTNIFVFCEPTRGIDIGVKIELYELLNNLVSKGSFILLVSSDLSEVIGISDRILVMHQGNIVKEYQRDEFNEERILKNAFRGK